MLCCVIYYRGRRFGLLVVVYIMISYVPWHDRTFPRVAAQASDRFACERGVRSSNGHAAGWHDGEEILRGSRKTLIDE